MKLKFSPGAQRRTALGAAALLFTALVTPTVARADFMDVLYLVQQIALLKSQLTTMTNQYNMVKNNVVSFTRKSTWSSMGNMLFHTPVPNRYGETAGWTAALNTNPLGALTAWNSSTLTMKATTYLQKQGALGDNTHLSNLASVEIMDASAPTCMSTIGQYRQQRATSQSAVTSLQTSELDTTNATNTEVEQLNLLNAAEAQRMNEMQAQGALQACLAEQQLVANTYRRNTEVESLNSYNHSIEMQTTNPSMQSDQMVNTIYGYTPK